MELCLLQGARQVEKGDDGEGGDGGGGVQEGGAQPDGRHHPENYQGECEHLLPASPAHGESVQSHLGE